MSGDNKYLLAVAATAATSSIATGLAVFAYERSCHHHQLSSSHLEWTLKEQSCKAHFQKIIERKEAEHEKALGAIVEAQQHEFHALSDRHKAAMAAKEEQHSAQLAQAVEAAVMEKEQELESMSTTPAVETSTPELSRQPPSSTSSAIRRSLHKQTGCATPGATPTAAAATTDCPQ